MKTKSVGILLIAGLIVLSAMVAPAVAKGNNKFLECFDYTIGTYNDTVGYTWVADLHPDVDTTKDAGDIEMYDNGSYLYIKTTVDPNVKPYLAWHEKDKKKGIDAADLSELKSDGETVEIRGKKYSWKVDPKKGEDQAPEIVVPSYTQTGMLIGPIVYIATIPVPTGTVVGNDVNICIEVHASPNDKDFVPIPEFSTIAIPVAAIIGLLFFYNRRKRRKE